MRFSLIKLNIAEYDGSGQNRFKQKRILKRIFATNLKVKQKEKHNSIKV